MTYLIRSELPKRKEISGNLPNGLETLQLASPLEGTLEIGWKVESCGLAQRSEKADSGVLHDLRPNRRSKLCDNAFDRLRVSDAGSLPSFQILTLWSACMVPGQMSNRLSHLQINEHIPYQQFPMTKIQLDDLFCFEHARYIVVEQGPFWYFGVFIWGFGIKFVVSVVRRARIC